MNYRKIHRVPRAALRVARNFMGRCFAMKKGISFEPPNYLFVNRFDSESICVDVGCAGDPDFSEFVINTFGCKSYGVDPTKKHSMALKEFEEKTGGKFTHLPYALGGESGVIRFFESNAEDSGSIKEDHVNVMGGNVVSYDVTILTVDKLITDHVKSKIALLKLDLEGAEYELINGIVPAHLETVDQIFVEFHHHCVERYSKSDTVECVNKLVSCGFKNITVDGRNFLFYRE